jgi:hypothetical protein
VKCLKLTCFLAPVLIVCDLAFPPLLIVCDLALPPLSIHDVTQRIFPGSLAPEVSELIPTLLFRMDQYMTQTLGSADWFAMEMPGVSMDIMTPTYPMRPAIPPINYESQNLGAKPLVQVFYEGPSKCDCCPNWIEKPPVQLPEAAKERYDQACVRRYKKKDHKSHSAGIGGLAAVKDHILELQGSLLIYFVTPILAEVGFLAPRKDKITFEAPFPGLYFSYLKIFDAAGALPSNDDARSHVHVLVTTIEEIS